MSDLKKCDVYHEIGHAIIGMIFQGFLMKVEKIILNKDDIKKLNLNVNDLAYTYQKGVKVDQEIIDENEYLYSMINGMNFLAGIAGATYFCPDKKPDLIEVKANNFNTILNTTGSSGDFEFINGKQLNGKVIMYYWYLFLKKQSTQEYAYEVHAYLINIIQDIFLDDRIRIVATKIYIFIIDNPNTNVEYEKLSELFPKELQIEFRNDIVKKFNSTK